MHVDGKDDTKLKILGELLSNDTSRTILILLKENEMYKQQIAKEIGIGVSTVIYHISKMEEIGLVFKSQKKIVRKGQEHNFYKISPKISIDLTKTQPDRKNYRNKVKDIWMFAVIFVAAIASYLFGVRSGGTDALVSDAPTPDLYPFIYPLIVVAVGLTAYLAYRKNKKKWD